MQSRKCHPNLFPTSISSSKWAQSAASKHIISDHFRPAIDTITYFASCLTLEPCCSPERRATVNSSHNTSESDKVPPRLGTCAEDCRMGRDSFCYRFVRTRLLGHHEGPSTLTAGIMGAPERFPAQLRVRSQSRATLRCVRPSAVKPCFSAARNLEERAT